MGKCGEDQKNFESPAMPDGKELVGMLGGFGGMGSGETKLQYIGDDPESYSAIFPIT